MQIYDFVDEGLGRTDLVVFDGSPETWSLATRIPLEAS